MADITWLGARWQGVGYVSLPKTGGGEASFHDLSGDTLSDASQLSEGIIAHLADGSQVTGTGSGGAKYVTGEFTAQSSAGVQTIDIPYNGNGFPIAAMVYVKGGINNSTASGQSDWYNSLTRYNVGQWTMQKAVQDLSPSFGSATTSENQACVTSVFKNSTSSATSYSRGSSVSAIIFTSSNPSTSSNGVACIRFMSPKVMRANVVTSAAYGLMAGITYTYHIVYSE